MAASTTFSLFFPLPNKHQQWPDCDDHSCSITNTSPSSSSTSVDCTLSLWTPSSRRAAAEPAVDITNNKYKVYRDEVAAADHHHHHQTLSYYYRQGQGHGGKAKVCAAAFADRRCANCGTSSTPLWRNGPRGPKSLCNACGIRFKKEERRAAAMETAGCGYIAQRAQYEYGGGPGIADAANEQFLAWRLNVVAPAPAPAFAAVWPERTSLFQYN